MASLDFTSSINSLVVKLVETICPLVCGPFYDDIKTYFQALALPELLRDNSMRLSELLTQIRVLDTSDEIVNWNNEAVEILQKVRSSNRYDDRLSCFCYGDACSRCQLYKDIKKLIDRGNGIINRPTLLPKTVEVIRNVPVIVEGSTAEINFKKVMDMLSNVQVWSIGICGPGGVGKTALAHAINNKLANNSSFTLVRVISLTKDVNEKQVQEAIVEKLRLNVEEGMQTTEIADRIYNTLRKEKFLLILDNVWKSIALENIGIPLKQTGSKVMLTTRQETVCRRMEAEPVRIGCLAPKEAWKLFVEKTGDVATGREIQQTAQNVCKECGGLPLAIVALGSAMRGKTTIHEWESALIDLQSSKIPDGIESEVDKPLKLSFDSLPDDDLKSCFLYCSLYPEGYFINVDELIQCWLAENIIDDNLSYEKASSKGLDLIEKLKNSYLLETGEYGFGTKMHDVVRDVAIRIAESKDTSVVCSGHGFNYRANVAFPNEVGNIRWMSFVDNEKLVLPQDKKDFPKVTTLLVYKTKELIQFFNEFLQGFPALRILILSSTQIEGSIEADVILNLSALERLNMISTGYKWPTTRRRSKSKEVVLQDLSKLMSLKEVYLELADVEANYAECSWMERLKSFMFVYGGWGSPRFRDRGKDIIISADEIEIGSFVLHANNLTLKSSDGYANGNKVFAKFYSNDFSTSKLKSLYIGNYFFSMETGSVPNSNAVQNLEFLTLSGIDGVRSFNQIAYALGTAAFPKLREVRIFGGRSLRGSGSSIELENIFSSDYPHMELPELEGIHVIDCKTMTEVFHDGPANTQAFAPKLKLLRLEDMESLQSLCSSESSQQCASLEELAVLNCPNLTKLPNMRSIKEIRGEKKWWNNLEWGNPETESHMSEFFVPRRR